MKRRQAREIAVISLYQMEMNEVSAKDAIMMVLEEARSGSENETLIEVKNEPKTVEYVQSLIEGILSWKEAIDKLLSAYLTGWQVERLSRVDKQILRLAVYEMVYCEDIPAKVAVNEAIELAKHFGTDESGRFVNGVLGKMINQVEGIKEKQTE